MHIVFFNQKPILYKFSIVFFCPTRLWINTAYSAHLHDNGIWLCIVVTWGNVSIISALQDIV